MIDQEGMRAARHRLRRRRDRPAPQPPECDGEHRQQCGDAEKRQLGRIGFGAAIGLERLRRQACRIRRLAQSAREDQHRTENGCDGGAERIEGLREDETARRGLGLSQNGDQRIGGDLQDGDAAGHDEERGKKLVSLRG